MYELNKLRDIYIYTYIYFIQDWLNFAIPGTIKHPNNLVRPPHELPTCLSALGLVLGVVVEAWICNRPKLPLRGLHRTRAGETGFVWPEDSGRKEERSYV